MDCFTQTAVNRSFYLSCWPPEGSGGTQVWRTEGEPSLCPSRTSPGQWSETDQRWLPCQPFPLLLCTQKRACQRIHSGEALRFNARWALVFVQRGHEYCAELSFTQYLTYTLPLHILLVLKEILTSYSRWDLSGRVNLLLPLHIISCIHLLVSWLAPEQH